VKALLLSRYLSRYLSRCVLSCLWWMLLTVAGCGTVASFTPVVQRVIVQADSVTVYQVSGRASAGSGANSSASGNAANSRKLSMPLGVARRGDTLLSYAHGMQQAEQRTEQGADSVERHFYVVFRGAQGWIHQGSGTMSRRLVVGEYDLLASLCDTKFSLPASADSLAWARALDYVKRHSVRPLQTTNDELIENSLRGRMDSERDIVFVVRRVPPPSLPQSSSQSSSQHLSQNVSQNQIAYTVRADGSATSLHARRCALYMQTGKDERNFYGIENVERSSLRPYSK
jgi:hypothetical protein